MKAGILRDFWNFHDFILLAISFIAALFIITSEPFSDFVSNLGEIEYIGVFVSGMLFSYGFTTAPAASVLFVSSKSLNPFLVALIGATGAMFSDYLMFRFFKGEFLSEIRHLSDRFHFHPHLNNTIHRIANKMSCVIGGLILASPLPDELAASFCGSIRMGTRKFTMIAFVFKFFGILSIALLAGL
ncbi:MAG: hypothetical protein QXN71_02675 [Candidatus Aenigmatarchaeota archaeon]